MASLHIYLLTLLTLSCVCADDNPSEKLVAGNMQFAVDLFQELKRGENVLFAPVSLSTVFAMLYLGADTKTKEQMAKTLHFDRVSGDELHNGFKDLNSTIMNTTCSLFAANRLYAQQSQPISDEYSSKLKHYYNTEFIESDFRNNAETIRQNINDWVHTQTRGRISDLISEGSLDSRTAMVLLNALYFKGDWFSAFHAEDTQVDLFHLNNEKSIHTLIMYQSGRFNYGYSEALQSQIIELPFEDNQISMVIILPDANDGIYELQEKLTPTHLNAAKLYKTKVDVYIPKFKIEYSFDVRDVLLKLGVEDLFSPGICDLSAIDGTKDLFVSQVFHKAFLEVNEEGAEAAAATHATISRRSAPSPPEMFVADHPFIFFIRDIKTKSILFLGRLMDPEPVSAMKDEL